MRTLSVFTSWHPAGYKKYGQQFIEGYNNCWPQTVPLTIYAEDHEPVTNNPNITVLDQATTLPDLKAWQLRHKDNKHAHGWNHDMSKKSFLWDASRFANKTFALWHFAKTCGTDIFMWCDGDVRTHTPMPIEFLNAIATNENFKKVLLVDDLSDTGLTLNKSIDWLKEYDPIKNYIKEIKTACLWKKKSSSFTPDFCPILLKNDPWIVQPSEYYDEVDIEALKKKHS